MCGLEVHHCRSTSHPPEKKESFSEVAQLRVLRLVDPCGHGIPEGRKDDLVRLFGTRLFVSMTVRWSGKFESDLSVILGRYWLLGNSTYSMNVRVVDIDGCCVEKRVFG